MAQNGVYGTKKPALITSKDVDMYYYYRPTRNTESADFENFKKLDSKLLVGSKAPIGTEGELISTLPGMYDLRLPLSEFGEPGIYTVYIKPKEIFGTISDVSTLASYPNVRGIVIDAANFENSTGDASIFTNGNLVGYRIDYFDDNVQRNELSRIITSNNRCEPVAQNMNDPNAKGVRYRFNDSSSLVFCTVSPSTALSFRSTSIPYIGTTGQKIALVNTKFNPVMIEIEMVEHDMDGLYNLVGGDQIRDLNHGLITTFDSEGNITHQASYGQVSNTSKDIYHEFKISNNGVTDFEQENALKKIKANI